MSRKKKGRHADQANHEIDTAEARENLERRFPGLASVGYQITSKRDSSHNCIAYAAGDYRRRWGGRFAAIVKGYYWPPNAKRGSGIDELIYAFESIGFKRLEGDHSENYEAGIVKVALYIDDMGKWSHAAIQCIDRKGWMSKIGEHLEDIWHAKPDAFEGPIGYGRVCCYMGRSIKGTPHDAEEGQQEVESYE